MTPAGTSRVLPGTVRGLLLLLALGVLGGVAAPADAAKTPKACRRCRIECRDEARLAACIESDPRLPKCSAKRRAFCLKRARRNCKHNLKTCCSRQCRTTGLVQCCGSAISGRPGGPGGGGGSTTTTTGPGGTTTTTTPSGGTPCTSDADCPTCQCCRLASQRCGGADGGSFTQCCATPQTPAPQCGPKSPSACPSNTTCDPPGGQGGTYYWCGYCAGSGNIIEAFVTTPSPPPISTPSNACTRR